MLEECEALKCLQRSHQKEIDRLQSIQKETELLLAEILRYHLTNCVYGTVTAHTDTEREAFRLLGWHTELSMSEDAVINWIRKRKNDMRIKGYI